MFYYESTIITEIEILVGFEGLTCKLTVHLINCNYETMKLDPTNYN